jgi:hypothetical protein
MVRALAALAVLATLAMVTTTSKHTVPSVYASNQTPSCTFDTLKGSNYGFTFSGFSSHPPQFNGSNVSPFHGEGLGNFYIDMLTGVQTFSATYAATLNTASSTDNPYIATVTVNPNNCTGWFTSTSGGDNFGFVIVGGGSEILATDVSGSPLSLDLKKL